MKLKKFDVVELNNGNKATIFDTKNNELYGEIVNEWLPDSGYEIANAPEISVIHKFNNDKDNCYVELWIPIENRNS